MLSSILPTPYGPLQISVNDDGALVEILLPNRPHARPADTAATHAASDGMRNALTQLTEYFAGTRRTFELPIDPHGSPFERRVWERVSAVPYGATTSYGAIASELGLTNAARAVGHANGANPIPIVIPCHRVIGANGALTGYGGGLELKCALLELEGARPKSMIQFVSHVAPPSTENACSQRGFPASRPSHR